MSFSKNTLTAALDIVKKRGKTAEERYEEQIEFLRTDNKKYRELDGKLKQLGTKLCVSAFSGNSAETQKLQVQIETLQKLKDEILKENGIKKEITHICQKCNDTGYADNRLCDCVLEEAKRIRHKELSKNMPIENCTFDNFKLTYYENTPNETGFTPRKVAKKTLDICKEFCASFPNGENLFFCGGCGLGKTHLTLSVANEIIDAGFDVIYGSAQNIISKIGKEQFNYGDENDYLESILDCDLLILDDLGTEFSTALSTSVVYNIINTRILRNKSTIISTNLSIKEIENTYSSRIVSRINGNYIMRMFIGNDIRQLKKAENKE